MSPCWLIEPVTESPVEWEYLTEPIATRIFRSSWRCRHRRRCRLLKANTGGQGNRFRANAFGKPVRIRQSAALGSGLITWRRESTVSGRFHDIGCKSIAVPRMQFAQAINALFPGRQYLL